MMKPKVESTLESMKPCSHDLYDAPVFQDKEGSDNMARAAQANLDRFGLNPEKFVERPRPNGRET